MQSVIKRDGQKVEFNLHRIETAVSRAMDSVANADAALLTHLCTEIEIKLSKKPALDIQEIQRTVEETLIEHQLTDVARAYISYRKSRDIERERRSSLNEEIKSLLMQSNDDLLNENANKDANVIPTQRDLLAGIVARHYAKAHILSEQIVTAHESGAIHYHDLDYAPFFPMFNCMLVDLKGMLCNGFKMGNAEIASPKSIMTATNVTAQIIAQVASHIYGGTTIDRIDEVLEPYVTLSYEKHLAMAGQWNIPDQEGYAHAQIERECYDAFQALEYEVNTLHTSNGQTPFVTFGFGLGKSWQAKLIQQSILNVRIDGLGKNKKTAVFPKLVFAIKKGINQQPEDPNYDIKQLALECASQRMYPDILNYDQVVEKTGSFKTPMGCRSFLGKYEHEGTELHAGRNNLGVVSLNLPRIALQANGNVELFFEQLQQQLLICKEALMSRIERLQKVKAKIAPILYMEGACGVRLKAEDNISELFKNGRASISLGYIGIHETINALFGDDAHLFDDPQRQQVAVEIVKTLKAAVDLWTQQTGYGFSLYSTPSENLCTRFCKIDQKEFGSIKGVTDKGYYTNSFHLDVEKKVNPYDKIDFEQPYPAIASGGFICYGEYPNMRHNLKALEDIWDYSYNRVPYYGTNTPIDECYSCGYQGEFDCTSKGFSCPSCGNKENDKMSVTRRVCGYLGSPNARPFNAGKQEEVIRRVKHLENS
ncbi:anaerobic ribonucleoside-triphosphate reductase [Reinekea marinisedimentorum]|uniref:Ribonucleoside-triphosphate reductase n=1 Tax=Reinekea marinisedimentorum TaxID=230495 RepID=A0A4V2UK71_9GAMM|nr:anaerobic ribonucleoside-triphosphate reductase [Reinekea marinisedimentorum]TCS43142.1 ribonucleoside-triphosphate reductase [Reinekea marinisedimentorum]